MPYMNLNEVPEREIIPGFRARFVHSANMSFAHWSIDQDAILPEHSHEHEQVVNVIDGEFELSIDDDTRRLRRGEVAVIPPNAVHSGRAITDCRVIDVFYPIREDYRGDAAALVFK